MIACTRLITLRPEESCRINYKTTHIFWSSFRVVLYLFCEKLSEMLRSVTLMHLVVRKFYVASDKIFQNSTKCTIAFFCFESRWFESITPLEHLQSAMNLRSISESSFFSGGFSKWFQNVECVSMYCHYELTALTGSWKSLIILDRVHEVCIDVITVHHV